jgi:hypothetical protein
MSNSQDPIRPLGLELSAEGKPRWDFVIIIGLSLLSILICCGIAAWTIVQVNT